MSDTSVKTLLKRYIPLVDFFADVLGPNSEIVLNDVTDLDHSVVYIKNNQLTNRKVGDPASDFVLKITKNGVNKQTNYIANYSGKSKGYDNLRSSTFFIRKDQKLVGMLCVNINQEPLDSLIKDINNFKKIFELPTTSLGHFETPEVEASNQPFGKISENFNNSVKTIAQNVVQKKENELNLDAKDFNPVQKISLIRELYKDGYFMLKDSAKVTASYLHCSIPTIYRYLSTVKSEEKIHS